MHEPLPKVYVVKAVENDGRPIDGVWDSLKSGKARIGWSYKDGLDLRTLRKMRRRGERFDEKEGDAWRCRRFLTDVAPGDYLVYPHQPKRGYFAVVRVDERNGEYEYDSPNDGLDGDFRSYRRCELVTEHPLNWKDAIVPPTVKHRLGLQGRFYEMKAQKAFFEMLEKKDEAGQLEGDGSEHRLARIAAALQEGLPNLIQSEFPNHDLSRRLVADLCEAMGYAVDVQEGPNEKGSDLVVMVGSDLLPEGFERRVGIQVFAYRDEVSPKSVTRKLNQLLDGWDDNQLDSGVLLTTGECNDAARLVVENHNEGHPNEPVVVIDGNSLSEMFLKYFGGELAGSLGRQPTF